MFVPARLREELGKEFYVTITPEKCIQMYPLARWEDALDKLRLMSQKEQRSLRPIFAKAAHCVPDSQWRIQLTPELREHGNLAKDITIVGTGLYAQIWDSEAYKLVEEKENNPENIEQAMEDLGF